MFPAYSVILTCSPSYKLVFCAWVSQILLSNQYNIQSNYPTGSHSCCSRRLHLQGEPPTFSLFRASFITCCHHFICSFRCHLLLHAFVSAVYSASTSQILVCLTCESSSLVVVEWADGSFLPVSGLIMKLFGPVSCLHNLDLGFACEISLKVLSKTCLLRVFSTLHGLSHLALHLFLSCV